MVRPFRRVRLLGTVPISIAVHLVVIVFLLIIPLVANMTTPLPHETASAFVRAVPAPPPPDLPQPLRAAPRAPQPLAAPTTAPPAIVRGPVTPDVPALEPATGALGSGAAALGSAVSTVAPPRSPEPPRRVGPIRVAELPVAPVKIVDVLPVYPEIARAAHVGGTVTLECIIDPSGRIMNIHVLTSVPLLDRAAIDAVRQWRYTPSLYNGRPVSVLMTVTVRFVMK